MRVDAVPANDVLFHKAEADYYLQTHCTNALLYTETIAKAIKLFLDNYPSYDSLCSVISVSGRL